MANLTIAASEDSFRRLFGAVRDGFRFARADSRDFGRFSAGYDIAFHLEGGTIDLRADNTILVSELDIKWDRLDLSLLAMLGAQIAGRPADPARLQGVAPPLLMQCLDWLRAARYGVAIWAAADLELPHAELTLQALSRLLRTWRRINRG